MIYNLLIKSVFDPKLQVLVGFPQIELQKLITAFNLGKENALVNGKRLHLGNISLIKIYDTVNVAKQSESNIKNNLTKEIKLYGLKNVLPIFKRYGHDVTSKHITGDWGDQKQRNRPVVVNILSARTYISSSRIDELKNIKHSGFDLTKLNRLCEEINMAFKNELYLATGLLVRSLIDHIPPIFECKNFSEVSNNYKAQGNSKSFKESMEQLDKSMRKISDKIVHSQITKSETLPNETQVDCKRDLDVLLEEIVRILKK